MAVRPARLINDIFEGITHIICRGTLLSCAVRTVHRPARGRTDAGRCANFSFRQPLTCAAGLPGLAISGPKKQIWHLLKLVGFKIF